MTNYVDNVYLVTIECYKCGICFAMTQDFNNNRLKDRESFYCPSGHRQSYIGETPEQKLKIKLADKDRELQSKNNTIIYLKTDLNSVNKSYSKMRKRIANGVCPCCTRTFQNLMQHMKTEHPDFSKHKVLKTLRESFGLSQSRLAEEIGTQAAYISLYEREKPVPGSAVSDIEYWIDQQESA